MRRGPKGDIDPSPLPFRSRKTGSDRFAAWCLKYLRVPKGTGALKPLRLRDWQLDLVGSVLDAEVPPRVAGWCLPRGSGKSTLVAALGLFSLMEGGEGATVIVAAVDERQAQIVYGTAKRFVELSPELDARIAVYKDRLLVPSRGASFACLPASPAALEGLDYSTAIVDEIGVCDPAVFEVIALAQGKREKSVLIGIGTPGAKDGNILARLREYSIDHPEDTSQVYREFSAADFTHHPPSCEHCWELANPALDDFLHRDGLRALLPPKTSEAAFRRARLCQFIGPVEESFLTAEVWDGLSTGEPIPEGSEVVLGVDASLKDDSTAIVIGSVSAVPHFDKWAVWEKPANDPDWRVDVLAVEQAIRDAAKRYRVKEIAYDPYLFTRSAQILAAEGLPMVEFRQSPPRQTAATNDLHSGAVNARFTHSGDPDLRRHVLAATVLESDKGIRLAKASRSRTAAKCDLAVALMMCHSRATYLASSRRRRRAYSFAS